MALAIALAACRICSSKDASPNIGVRFYFIIIYIMRCGCSLGFGELGMVRRVRWGLIGLGRCGLEGGWEEVGGGVGGGWSTWKRGAGGMGREKD